MTGLWAIALAILILAGVVAHTARRYFDQSRLEALTDEDVARLTAPYVDGPFVRQNGAGEGDGRP